MKKIESLSQSASAAHLVTPARAGRRRRHKITGLMLRLGSVFLIAFTMLLVAFLWLLGVPEVMRAASPPARYVAPAPIGDDQAGANDCTNSFAPCASIQRAIDAADAGDEIRVASGRYTDTNNLSEDATSRTQAVYLNKSVTLRGGFTTTNWAVSDVSANRTIIDAQGDGRVLRVPNGGSIVATVNGFHLTGGEVTDDSGGAGIYNGGELLTLEDNEIYGNEVTASTSLVGGGGIIQRSSVGSTILFNNQIYSNSATSSGANALGGGVGIVSGTLILEANKIFSNTADNFGGGIVVFDGEVTSKSNLVYNNTSASGGGLVINTGSTAILNDTIYGNSASTNGGGIVDFGTATVAITNTLLVSNTANSGGGIHSPDLSQIAFTDLFGNTPDNVAGGMGDPVPGNSNTNNNPNFVNPAAFNLHLSPGSPAIDSGTDVALTFDYEGQGRPFGSGFDRGADESIDSAATCFARVEGGTVYTNVQQAIDEANSGDLVQVAGICTEVDTVNSLTQIAYISETLTLRGGYTSTDWVDPVYGPTVLDANNSGRAVYIEGVSSINPTIENLRLTGGSAADGAGVYLGSNVIATLRNNVINDNTATGQGGGVYNSAGSTSTLLHNTIYGNNAATGGGVYGAGGGQVTLRSNIVANNTGDGLAAPTANAVNLDYNNFNNTTNYSNPAFAGPNDISDSPSFENPGANDFRLQPDSTSINAADPASPVTTDFQNDPRPQGSRSDIGADESRFYAAVLLSIAPEDPVVVTDTAQIANSFITFTHTITNLGNTPTLTDTFDLTTFNSDGLTISGVPASVTLDAGDSTTFEVVVEMPGTVPEPLFNQTILTATSQTNAGTFASVTDLIAAPGVELVDNDSPPFEDPQNVDPGDVITYTYTLRNSGPITDSFVITMNSAPFGWGTLIVPTDTTPITLAAGSSTPIQVRVAVAETAPAGLAELVTVIATSQNFDVSATVTDTTEANGTVGDRYVSTTGSNTNNNCTVSTSPCRTINYAVGQAATGDAVRVAQGGYTISSGGININDPIQLVGGYNAGFSNQTGSPADTQIDFNSGRGLNINAPAGPFAITIDNLTLNNASASGPGGGIFLQQSPAITLSRLVVQDSAATRGGGIYLSSSTSPIIVDQVVVSNTTAGSFGGGIYVAGGSPLLSNVVISDTTAERGGGVYIAGGSPTITGSTIFSAGASLGGGVYQAAGTLAVERTRLHSNSATSGGGIYVAGGTLELQNNFVYSNSSTEGGAGVYNNATLQAVNNTLYANVAGGTGGGIFDNNTSGLVISNTIFAANSASNGGAIYRGDSGTVAASIDYNLYDSNTPNVSNVATGPNNVSAAPLFVDAASGDLHLTGDSPAVDSGDPGTTVPDDIDGDFRPINQGFDIGADELSGCLARLEEAPGTTYGVLQEAIDAANPGYTVQVSGICRGVQARLVGGQTLSQTALITKNLTLAGGYNSTFSNNPANNPVTTTLDAQSMGRTLVVSDAASVILTRLTLTGGDGSTGGDGTGGGLYNADTQLQAVDLTIFGNQAANGAGVYNLNGTLTLSQTGLLSNTAGSNGGGVYNAAGLLTSEMITAANNSAVNGGGFYNAAGAELNLRRSLIYTNSATDGAGVYNADGGTLSLINTILTDNEATNNGGGLYNESVDLTVRHDAFYLNTAGNQGGGIYHDGGSSTPVINSTILITNSATSGGGIYSANLNPSFRYNNAVGNSGGDYGGIGDQTGSNGNIAVDPNFLSTVLTDTDFLRIPSGSPVEDQGDPDSPVIIDIEGDPRPSNQNPDIGVDEVAGCFARINTDPRIYGNVQTAIDDSSAGDLIRVAGVCAGVRPFDDGGTTAEQTILITKPITVQGGYTKTNDLAGSPDPVANPTILDALDSGRVVYITMPQTISGSLIVIDGLHLRGGNEDDGGAVLVRSGVVSMTHNRIYSNTAVRGGAINNETGTVTLQGDNLLETGDNEIYGNTATADGGAIYNAGGQMTVDDVLLYNNGTTDGGAFFHAGGVSLLQNNVIRDNNATNGGAVYNASTGLTVRHNTIYSNDATNGGGLSTENDTLTVVNNIFSENSATAGHAIYGPASFAPDYNNAFPADNAYGGGASAGANSLAVDPNFVDAANGDFHLDGNSPVIDAGDPAMTLTYDFDDPFDTRPSNQGFDLGADEAPGCLAKVVESDTVYGNLQTAINNSQPGNTILVTADECRGVHPFNPGSGVISQTVHVTHSLTIEGGYNDSFSSVSGETILNPDGQGRALFIGSTTGVTMTNFALTSGAATGLTGGPGGNDAGGGAYLQGSSALFENVMVLSSTAQSGGGIFIDSTSSLSLTGESQVYSNTVTASGGGIYNDGALSIEGSQVYGNQADVDGGGLYNDGTLSLSGNEIYDNEADFLGSGQGGGLFNNASATITQGDRFYGNRANEGAAIYHATGNNLTLWNTLLYENEAFNRGGAVYVNGGGPSILHNTFYANQVQSGTGQGGAIYVNTGGVTIKNNIFTQNEVNGTENAIHTAASGATISYNNYSVTDAGSQVTGSVGAGSNNVNADPNFVDPDNGDFHLTPSSPVINTADSSAVTNDFEGDPRPINSTSDMGADEVNACLARVRSAPDTIYGSVQTAINAASAGEIVDVAAGVCEENLSITKNITIDGSWQKDFSGKVTSGGSSPVITTTIDGSSSDRVVDITSAAADVTLSQIRLTNGDAGAGNGGGIRSQAGSLTLTLVDVISNTATDGGGIYVGSGNQLQGEGLFVSENTATGSGGGLYLASNVTATLTADSDVASAIFNNDALAGSGGGIHKASGGELNLGDTGVSGNTAGSNGGGIYSGSGSPLFTSGGAPIAGNQAGGDGGGIYLDSADLDLSQKQVNDNSAAAGAGLYIAGSSDVVLTNLGMYSNTATTGNGGGIYRDSTGSTIVKHGTFNTNRAPSGSGGAIYNTGNSMVVSATILASSEASSGGVNIQADANVDVAYTLRDSDDTFSGSITDLGGNIIGDPRLRTTGGDLLFDSPAIDAVPTAASDVDVDRFLDERPQLCAKDMGRDEYSVGSRLLEWAGPTPANATLVPPEAVTYTYVVTNSSQNYSGGDPVGDPGNGYTETVTVTLNSSEDWSEIISVVGGTNVVTATGGQSATMLLGPGQAATFLVQTTVPTGTFADAEDSTTLAAVGRQCSDGNPTSRTSTAAVTSVEEGLSFVIVPDNFGTAAPGDVLTFTHTLSNTGNLTDTYTLFSNASGPYVSGVIMQPPAPDNQVTLGPTMSSTIIISLTVSPAAGEGLVETVSAIARSGADETQQVGAANTLTISGTTGTRYVSLLGEDLRNTSITDTTVAGDNNCTQTDFPCRSIQWALGQAAPDDLIKIEQGTYNVVGTDIVTAVYNSLTVTQIAFIDKAVTLQGGYDDTNWDEDPPSHVTQTTTLDPDGQGRAVLVTNAPTGTVTIDRLTIANGDATGLTGGPGDADAGGGLYNDGADLTLTALRLQDSNAAYGGSLYSSNGVLLLQNNFIHGNAATNDGGALYVEDGTATLENNTFFSNSAQNGGALYINQGTLLVSNTIVATNTSGGSSGAIDSNTATATLDYNLYAGNTPGDVGGMASKGSNAIDGNPAFINAGANPPDLHIGSASAARDSGDPASTLSIDYDNDSRPLPNPGVIDRGADEREPVQSITFITNTFTLTTAPTTFAITHTLTNDGDVDEEITLSQSSDQDWFDSSDPTIGAPFTLTSQQSRTVTVTYTVPATATGLTNITTITATATSTAVQPAAVVDTIRARGPLWEITKTAEPSDTVQPGGLITYTLTVTNSGELSATTDFTITDQLPLTYVNVVSADPAPVNSPDPVQWRLSDNVGISESLTVTLVVSANTVLTDGLAIVNEAYSVTGGGTVGVATGQPVTVTVESAVDVSISKAANAGPVRPGEIFTYTITITNDSVSGPVVDAVVTDTLPAEVEPMSLSFVDPATGTTSTAGSDLEWQLDSVIPVGGDAQVQATVRVTSPLAAGTLLTNSFGITAANIPAVRSDSITTLVTATNSITLSKSVVPTATTSGGEVTYTITLTNSGDGIASVALTDALESGFSPTAVFTDVTVPGRNWGGDDGVATVSFTATAPLTAGTYFNPAITATYGLSQAVLSNSAPLSVSAVVVDFSSDSFTVAETAGSATITVTLSAAAPQDVSVDYESADVTATAGSDYTAVTDTLIISAGLTTATFSVPISDDARFEGDELVSLTLSNPQGATLSGALNNPAELTILDDETQPTVDFSAGGYTVDESVGTATFTVTLSAAVQPTVTVEYSTSDLTAAAGEDYLAGSEVLTFPSLITETTFTVPITDDLLYEADEIFRLTLSNPVSATLGTTNNPADVTILDNDAAQQPSVEFAAGAYSVNEPAGTASITLTLSTVSGAETAVTVTLTDETATAGSDYVDASGTVTFSAGVTQSFLTIPITDDVEFETNETLSMTLSNPVSATLGTTTAAQLTILDDDFLPTIDFLIAGYSVDENEPSGQAVITVTLSAPVTETVSIDYESSDGTATAGSDYTAVSDTLTFPISTTVQTFTVPILTDSTLEGSETVTLTLSNPVSGTLAGAVNNPAVLTILDDEAVTADFSSTTYSVDESAGTATITVTLSGDPGQEVGVEYATADGTATVGSDYDAASGTLTFTTALTERSFAVTISEDSLFEADETVILTLLNPDLVNIGSTSPATLTITDNDSAPEVDFAAAGYSVDETAGTASITVSLSAASGITATVDYATSDNTATAGSDYTAGNGTVTFSPGLTTTSFNVSITDDGIFEGSESLTLTLSAPVSATLATGGNNPASLTIIDNELPSVAFDAVDYSVDEGAGTAAITVSLSAAAGFTATVDYATADGTATSPADYSAQSGTLTFGPDESSTTFTVPIVDDSQIEGNETITLTLSAPVSATLAATDTATLTILDNDTPTVDFSTATYEVDENGGPATITVTLSISSAEQATVDYATADGSATLAGNDYVSATGTLTFASGITIQTFSVPVNNDTDLEGSETVSLSLSNAVNANLGTDNNPATLTIIDDDASTITFDPASYPVVESVGTAVITVTMTPTQTVAASVDYFTSDGTATSPADYTDTSSTLNFPPNTSELTFTVSISDDSVFESLEQFQLNLTNVVSANLGSPTGTVSIIDNDAPPEAGFEATDFTVDEDAGTATITVTLSAASELSATVDYATADGTASSASDYSAVTGTLTFDAGDTSATFSVPITDDTLFEADETVLLSLSNPVNATTGVNSATLTILDDETAPVVGFDSEFYTVQESVGSAVITVTLTPTSGTTAAVDYQTSDDTAFAGSDYTASSGTLNFNAGTSLLTFTVAITQDDLFENDEQLLLDLSNAISATLGISQATLIIQDDDPTPVFDFSAANYNVDEDAGPATITVTLSAAAGVTRTVGYTTADGTAVSTQDYVATSDVLTFTPGITRLTFPVAITDDLAVEGDEDLQLSLLDPSSGEGSGSLITTSTLTILDDDDAPDNPMLIAPPNGTVTNSNNIDLVWSRVDDALTYTLYLTPTGVFDIPDPGTSPVVSSTVLSEGVYSWTVAALNALSISSGITDTWVFTIDNTAPAAPSLIAPPDGTLTNDANVTFDWSEVADAASYRLALTSPTTSTILGPFTDSSALVPLVDGDGVYTWTVEAIDAATNRSGFTDTWTLTLDTTPPTSPTLILPPDGSVFTQTNVITFEWTAAVDALSGPVTYTLSLNDTPTQTLALTTTTLTMTDGVYNWTVSATDGAGNTAITGTHVFTVDLNPPPMPSLISPPDGTFTNQPVTFVWSAAPDTLTYTLSISDFGTIDVSGAQTSTVEALPEGIYNWTVRAIDSYSRTLGYTDTWQVTVDLTPPTTPTLIAPPDGSVITTTVRPTFEWTASTDALSGPVTYTLVLTDSGGLTTTFAVSGTTFTPTVDLALDSYTWIIEANDRAGNITPSTAFSFTLQAPPGQLFFPLLLKGDEVLPPRPGPDLIISDFSVTPNGDGTYRLSVTAINQGTVSVANPNNFHIGVYDTADLTSPLLLIGVQGEWFPVGGGRTFTIDDYTIPGSGNITLRAWADPFDVVLESDNDNNTDDLSLTITTATGVSPQAVPTYPPGPQPTPTQTR